MENYWGMSSPSFIENLRIYLLSKDDAVLYSAFFSAFVWGLFNYFFSWNKFGSIFFFLKHAINSNDINSLMALHLCFKKVVSKGYIFSYLWQYFMYVCPSKQIMSMLVRHLHDT